jgi:hypothetical protein
MVFIIRCVLGLPRFAKYQGVRDVTLHPGPRRKAEDSDTV